MDQTIANEVHEMIVSTIIHDIPSETSVEQTYPFYIYIYTSNAWRTNNPRVSIEFPYVLSRKIPGFPRR